MVCLLKYERKLLEIGFENTYFKVFQGFPALKETRAHIQPNGQFWTIFGQNGQNGKFFKKALGKFLLCLHALTNCKVSEKSNERFSSNRVTDVRTNERESLGLQLRRETKNAQNTYLNHQNVEFGRPLKSPKRAKNEFSQGNHWHLC